MSGTSIVIPCYNEARRLPVSQLQSFAKGSSDLRFLLVNDGSTDDTLGVIRRLAEEDEGHFSVVDLQPNQGKAEAVRRGILGALEGEARYVGFWDADLATPLQAIPAFIELLDRRPQLEMIFGSRVQLLGRSIERSRLRHYLGRVFATAASLTLGLGVYDTQCGAKLFRASPELHELFAQPFITRWIFDVEILARLIRARRGRELPQPKDVIYELPLDSWHDVAGSKVRVSDFPKAVLEILKIQRHYLRR